MRTLSKHQYWFLLTVSLSLSVLASACSLAANQPAPAAEPSASVPEAAEPTPDTSGQSGGGVSVDVSGVAQGYSSQVVAAVPISTDRPLWDMLPEHIVLTLEGYPVQDHLMKPQIFLYPVQEMSSYQNVAHFAADLGALLQSQHLGQNLPYLPLYNAGQVMHAQVKFMDFQSGSGVRYLTQFDQALLPINNNELLYTFQGLTSDGRFYVAAVLPVNLPGLSADATVSDALPPEFFSNFPQYLANIVATLNQTAGSLYSPDLNALDALVQSIQVP